MTSHRQRLTLRSALVPLVALVATVGLAAPSPTAAAPAPSTRAQPAAATSAGTAAGTAGRTALGGTPQGSVTARREGPSVGVADGKGRRPSAATPPAVTDTAVTPVRLRAHRSTRTTLAGRTVRFAGSASAGRAGDRVVLQQLGSRGWRSLQAARIDVRLAFSFAVRAPAGTTSYRVVRPATAGYGRAVSSTLRVSAASCADMARPPGLSTWSTNPAASGTSSMATHLSRMFCSVAPHAQVRIAMYFLHPDVESEVILGALQTVHDYLGVTVETLLDQRAATPADIVRLRKLGTVYRCHFSCQTVDNPGAAMHDKFVTITDMSWARGADPAVWTSSANWQQRQLQKYWQTGILFYGDRRLTREYDARYEGMRGCATLKGGCGAWVPSVRGVRLPAAYKKVKIGKTWHDKGLSWLLGDPGSGTQVIFSPVTPRTDPVTDQLERYSCTAQHRTVRIAIYRMSVGRGRRVIAGLKGLKARGCDVRVLYSIGGAKRIMTEAPGMLADAGIARGCIYLSHDKFGYFDVVDRSTHQPRHVLWTGSQNLTEGNLSANDDTFMTSTAEQATGHWASDILGAGGWYLDRWKQMAAHPTSCVWHS